MIDIREWCEEHGISLRELANRAKMSASHVRTLADRSGGTKNAAIRLAKVMGVEPDDIWTERKRNYLEPTPNGHPVRMWRIATGTSLNRLARAVGISKASLCAIESGRSAPRSPTVARLHIVTGIPVRDLVEWDRRKENET